MAYLLDTGILLRLANKRETRYAAVRAEVGALISRQEQLFITIQNFAEFCNVFTRPVSSNGFGLPPAAAVQTFEHEIGPICAFLAETDAVCTELKRLIQTYAVSGKQVHDARLAGLKHPHA